MATASNDVAPSLLELMVNARCSALLMCIEINLSGLNSDEVDRHRGDAWEFAELAGYLHPNMPAPSMLGENTEIGDAWHYGQARHETEVAEAENEIRERQEIQKVEAVLRGDAGWDSIGMPSPEEAVKSLLAGECLCVNGHEVWLDDGVTWFTNAYGQDGALGDTPDIEMMSGFLSDMARGEEYGPVPH